MIDISLIIPTYNGGHKISNALDTLVSQETECRYEIIVAIDGSIDNTLEVLEPYKSSIPNLTIINQSNAGRSIIRNNGAKQAQGEILIFLDDDMRVENDFIQKHYSFHQKNKDSIVVGNQQEDTDKLSLDVHKFKYSLSKKWLTELESLGNPLPKKSVFITAANFSLPQDLFIKLNGFNKEMTDIEDWDLAIRASQIGIAIFFDSHIKGHHDDYFTSKKYIKRRREYRKAMNRFYEENTSRLKGHINREENKNTLKLIFFFFFSFRFWYRLIDKDFLTFIPKTLRYKIYSWVITSLSIYYSQKKLT